MQQVSVESAKVSECIDYLKQYGLMGRHFFLQLIKLCSQIIRNESNILRLTSPIKIVGDIHGQFFDLLNIFAKYGQAQDNQYLFLGDYVDRGTFCIEVLTLLMLLKVRYPTTFWLLRGNHESQLMSGHHNFRIECLKKYDAYTYDEVMNFFQMLPICAVIDGKYFAVHAGLSPEATTLNKIDAIDRFDDIQDAGPLCDMLWSDPVDKACNTWSRNINRGCSYFYSPSQTSQFLRNNELKMVIRAHEVQLHGYKYQFNGLQKVALTVFSAPNYCDTYKNKASLAIIDAKSFRVEVFEYVQHPIILPNYMHVIEWSFPLLGKLVTGMFKTLVRKKKTIRIKETEGNALLELETMRKVDLANMFWRFASQQSIQDLEQASKLNWDENKQSIGQEDEETFNLKRSSDRHEKFPCPTGLFGETSRLRPCFVKVNKVIHFEEEVPDQP